MAGLNNFPGFLTDIVQGSTKDFVISIRKDGAPVDITGSKFYLTIDTDRDISTTPLLEIIIDPPTDPVNGKTTGTISDSDTLSLPVGTVYYSVRYINPAGKAYVIDLGKIKVLAGVSSRID